LGDWGLDVGELGALEDAAVDLAIQLAGAVAFGGGELEVKQPLFLGFAAGHDDAVVGPAQLRPQCGRNFGIGLVELTHSLQVALFKAFDAGFLGLDEGGELCDRLLAPFGGLKAIADVLADRPVKLNQLLIGGGDDTVLRSLDQRQNFGELGLEVICHCFARTMLKPILTAA
jgi:hypothetical protein